MLRIIEVHKKDCHSSRKFRYMFRWPKSHGSPDV